MANVLLVYLLPNFIFLNKEKFQLEVDDITCDNETFLAPITLLKKSEKASDDLIISSILRVFGVSATTSFFLSFNAFHCHCKFLIIVPQLIFIDTISIITSS